MFEVASRLDPFYTEMAVREAQQERTRNTPAPAADSGDATAAMDVDAGTAVLETDGAPPPQQSTVSMETDPPNHAPPGSA